MSLHRAAHFTLLISIHAACLAAIWTGVSVGDLVLCAVLYLVRMFGVTAGYHRYFSHRSFKTSRPAQFVLAMLAASSAQKGPLWWSSHHRHHHQHSDTVEDVHSARHYGFWRSHMLWWMDIENAGTDMNRVKDLAKNRELLWLERWHALPVAALALGCYLWGGSSALIVGFCWSSVLVWHATFSINSLAHLIGHQPFKVDDDSRNHWLLALLTLGEGWHNNHHFYPTSARQGFFWWELDIVYMVLVGMSKVGLVWDLRVPPDRVLAQRGAGTAAGAP